MFYINDTLKNTLKNNRASSIICSDLYNVITMNKMDFFNSEFYDVRLIDGTIHYLLKEGKKTEVIKPGRFVMKFFNKKYLDKDIEIFSNICSSKRKVGEVLELVEGNNIPYYYLEYNYSLEYGKVGTLWKSCMRQEEKQKFFKIYVNNPENVKMLTLSMDGLVEARALIWYGVTDLMGNKYNLMDRIYTIKDNQVQIFKNWAFDNNLYVKMEQNHKEHRFINKEGNILDKELLLPIKWDGYERYPYFDTFKFLNEGYDKLSNQTTKKIVRFFQSTKGYVLQGVFCSWTKEYINSEKAVKTFDGNFCNSKDAIRSDYYDCYGTPDTMVYSSFYKWIPTYKGIWSDFYKTTIIKENSIYSEYINSYIPKENSVIINGNVYDKSQVFYSKTYNTYVFKNDVVSAFIYYGEQPIIDFLFKDDCVMIGDKFFIKKDCIKIGNEWFVKKHLGKDNKVMGEYEDFYSNKEKYNNINNFKDLLLYSKVLENKNIPKSKGKTKKSDFKVKSTNLYNLLTERRDERREVNFLEEEDEG